MLATNRQLQVKMLTSQLRPEWVTGDCFWGSIAYWLIAVGERRIARWEMGETIPSLEPTMGLRLHGITVGILEKEFSWNSGICTFACKLEGLMPNYTLTN